MGGGKNSALQALLEEAEVSNTGLARAVVQAGTREGIHLSTDTTAVKRMLNGAQPRWPVPRIVAAVHTQRLQREVGVGECGFLDRAPATDDPYDGLSCSGTLEGTVRTVIELSGRDMRRRKFLLGSAFSAGAFAEPALNALTVPPVSATARAGSGRRIGMAEVEILTEQVTHLRQLDCRYGSGRTRVQVIQLLNHEANELLHGSYSEKIGEALLPAVAKAAWLAGFTAGDVGRHALAQRYYIQALNLAMAGGDRLYAGYLLSQMGRMTQGIARGSLTEHDRVRHARQSVALARAGLTLTQGAATPLLVAQLHIAEGRGLALLGDVSGTRRAIREAEHHHERAHPSEEPSWLGTYTDASFAADLGRCLRDIGEPGPAAALITQAVDGFESWKIRNRCFVQIDLVSAHLLRRDWEQTAAVGRDALRTAADVSSSLALDGLRTLQRQMVPLRSTSPHLTDLDAQITDFLARATRRQQHYDR